MRYDEFFRAFHIGENNGCLRTHTTTWAIPEFFATTVLVTEEYRRKLPDQFSYDKWYQGNSSPRNHWANMVKDYDEKRLVDALMDELDDNNLKDILKAFGVEDEQGEINKNLLCVAIAQQFKAIIDGKGTADNKIQDIYLSGNIKADFADYITKACQRYNVMKLIGGDEVSLEDFFVCNTIGEKERVFADKKRIKCAFIDEPSLKSIRDVYKKTRNYDNLKTVLIGSGGCGKSLMLQHLFLQAAKEYKKTGVLPIFLELRYFTQSDEIMSFIVKTVAAKDNNFTEEAARRLMLSGRCQLLLDGFDEIDPSDVDAFLQKLEGFTDQYDKVQVVITSRQNESINGLHNYLKFYVWPFDNTQSLQLVDKILTYQNQLGERDAVIEYINNGFLKKDGVFASHPLLLTYVAMRYPAYKRFNDNPALFYRATYEALLSGHDDNKKPYDRVFKSVDNADQFSTVFKEFCAISYKDGTLHFDTNTFDNYFNRLKSYKNFKNPYKMNLKNFKHDVCSTACMMYEKEYDIFYIDPGFQEFLFAEYYAQADVAEMEELRLSLQRTPIDKLLRLEAIDMLCKSSDFKFKSYVILPFMESIFGGNEKKYFMNFLKACFDDVHIINVNEVVKSFSLLGMGAEIVLMPRNENRSKTILLNYVLKLLGIDTEYAFCLYTKDNVPSGTEFKRVKITEDMQETGKLLGQESMLDDKKCLLIDCKPLETYDYIALIHKNKYANDYLVDAENSVICFGTRITVDTYDLNDESEIYTELIENVISNSGDTYDVFGRLKAYYKALKRECRRNGL